MDFSEGQIVEFDGTPTFEKFYSPDSSWGSYLVSLDKEIPQAKQIFNTDFITDKIDSYYQINLSGKTQQLTIGMPYRFKAKLTNHSKYGWGYEILKSSQELPKTVDQQQKFLESIVTPNQAQVLLEAYPDIIEKVISGNEGDIDLNNTKGIKDHTWKLIREKIISNYAIADVLTLLSPLGISFSKIHKLLNFEPNAELLKQKLLNDPYIIIDIPGISFKQADNIAIKLNPEMKHSDKRVISFIKNYLRELGDGSGHTWLYLDDLTIAVKENLIECEEIYQSVIEKEKGFTTFLHFEKDEDDNWKVGLDYYYWVEREIWRYVKEFSESELLEITQEEINEGIKKAEEDQGFIFSEEQREALINITKNNFNLLCGPAGTGKSSISRGILNIYSNHPIACATLAAKASKRLEEVTGYPSSTLHRLLGADGLNNFKFDEYLKLPYDVILIDECSMLNGYLFLNLFKAIQTGTKVILVGDNFQLPPIGYANIFSDLLDKEGLQLNKLTKIHRQAEKSGIISDANKIRVGKNPVPQKSFKIVHGELEDLYYMFRDSRDALNEIAVKTFLRSITEESLSLDEVIILTPRKKDCINSTKKINRQIQDILLSDDVPYMEYGEIKYKIGSKVIHIRNDYEKGVMNGTLGYVDSLGINPDGEKVLVVKYDDQYIQYTKTELKDIDLAYALTTHKFQGSQCHTIISLIDNTHFMLLDRCYLYTTVTRAIKRCLILAEPWAFNKAIETDKNTSRNTWLKLL